MGIMEFSSFTDHISNLIYIQQGPGKLWLFLLLACNAYF